VRPRLEAKHNPAPNSTSPLGSGTAAGADGFDVTPAGMGPTSHSSGAREIGSRSFDDSAPLKKSGGVHTLTASIASTRLRSTLAASAVAVDDPGWIEVTMITPPPPPVTGGGSTTSSGGGDTGPPTRAAT